MFLLLTSGDEVKTQWHETADEHEAKRFLNKTAYHWVFWREAGQPVREILSM